MDWNKARSIVAGVGGVDVTFEDDDGQLGATRLPYSGQQSLMRQPTTWEKSTYLLQFIETSKHLTKPGGGPAKVGSMSFVATEAEALNWAQSATTSPGYCVALLRLVKQLTKPIEAQFSPFQRIVVWTSCLGFSDQVF